MTKNFKIGDKVFCLCKDRYAKESYLSKTQVYTIVNIYKKNQEIGGICLSISPNPVYPSWKYYEHDFVSANLTVEDKYNSLY